MGIGLDISNRDLAAMPVAPDRLIDPLIDPLIDINLDDLLDSIGLAARRGAFVRPMLRPLLRPLLRPTARRFARIVREFDDRVGAAGLAAGSEWLVRRMTGGLQVAGRFSVPGTGPLLVLANHPGMTDTVALFASLRARTDLRVIAQDRPFLRALPNVATKALFVADDGLSRTQVVRAGVKHLQQGGALLTFPAGAIEPDPAAHGARPAVDALQDWSASFTLFARAVPQTRIVTAIVSQVISADALHHPLTRWRRTAADRDKLAATLQILWPPYQAKPARVAFGAAATAQDQSPAELRRIIIERAGALIESPPTDWEA